MKQLKTILQSKIFYIILALLTLSEVLIKTKLINYRSIYKGDEKNFIGEIIKIKSSSKGYSLTIKCKEKIIVYIEKCPYQLGDKVLIKGTLSKPNKNTVFNNYNYQEYLYNQKIFYTINVDKISLIENNKNYIYKIKNIFYEYINNFKSQAYLKTFLLADQSFLDDNVYKTYQINGIAHLLSIGSIHIALLSFLFLKKLKNLKISKYIYLLLLFIYINLIDYPIALIRIFIYALISTINKKFDLKIKSNQIFFLTLVITLIINPFYINNKGFLYSYGISFILNINKKYITGNYFIKLIKLSIISFIYSIPFNIYFNYSINIFSIFYNLIFIPVYTFIVFPLSLLTIILPFFDSIYYHIVTNINDLSFILSNINFGIIIFKKINIIILIFYLIIYIYIIKNILNKKIKGLVLLIIILIIHFNINQIFKEKYIVYTDVSQGDSTLVSFNNKNILIDTGGVYNKNISKNIIIMLKSFGIRKINYLVLTHGDYDHMGEAINLVNNFKVEKVIFNCGPYNDLEQELIKVLDKKKIKYYSCIKELNIDNNKLYFLNTKVYDNENDNSNVIYTELDDYKYMFMGDASSITEKEILSKYNLPDIDILKVGHHGSKTSSSKEFINEINPKYSIISVGKNNRYGHPNKEVLNTLEQSKVYRTDQDGSIMFKIKNNKLNIETCSP